MFRGLLACVAALSVVALPGCVTSDDTPGSTTRESAVRHTCPSEIGVIRSGEQDTAVDETNTRTTWDLRRAVWHNSPDPVAYPIRSDAWTQGCIVGGTVVGNIPREWTRDQWYDGEDGGRSLGGEAFRISLTRSRRNFVTIRNAYVEDVEDGFDPNSSTSSATTYLKHVEAHYIRDDCIENEDVPHNLVVRNSLLDGCFAAFAQRPKGADTARNGRGDHRFKVVNSLVHVQPQPLGPDYCDRERVRRSRCVATDQPDVWLGAYGIWKWSEAAASKVVVKNTIFRLDLPSYSSCQSQRWPRGTYRRVTLVWLGPGRYRRAGGCHNVLPRGVRVTRNPDVWDDAVAAWRR